MVHCGEITVGHERVVHLTHEIHIFKRISVRITRRYYNDMNLYNLQLPIIMNMYKWRAKQLALLFLKTGISA